MIRDMKWYIWNNNSKEHPLCWDDKVLEFDSQEAATRFLESVKTAEAEREEMGYDDAIVDQAIVYWDGSHLNATNFKVDYDAEGCETILITVEEKA